jgi:predicted AAA+ superfamily ATPase
LEEAISNKKVFDWVWLDEVQKVPKLLDEVHKLMEERRIQFALSGSSARKLRREGANLLAGRALTLQMFGFSYNELAYDIPFAIEHGTLPMVLLDKSYAKDILRSYVQTYIKEEIKEEGAVRKIEPFLRFLEIAGMLHGTTVNSSNLAREAQIPRSSVDNYFSILIDTLIADFLPAYAPSLKVREREAPKFYWFDPGVARAAAGLTYQPFDPTWAGAALESLVFHELKCHNIFQKKYASLAYYKLPAGNEIDFVIETQKRMRDSHAKVVCVEVKNSKHWDTKWEKPIRSLAAERDIDVIGQYGVYRGSEILQRDNFLVLPVATFFERLHQGLIF